MKKLIVLALVCLSFSAQAAKLNTSADDKASESCPTGIKVATGTAKKGYANTYNNMKDVCAAKVNLCQIQTSGGLENLPLLSRKGADIGMAQMDTLQTMAKGDENIQNLQVVMPLNYNYLHIVVAKDGFGVQGDKKWYGAKGDVTMTRITKFSELKHRTVALVGSARLLGPVLNSIFKDYQMVFVEVKADADAFAQVKSGAVAAAFTVAGVPHGAVLNLKADSGLALATFDEELPNPYSVRKFNYDNIGAYNVKALAVQNVLLTRPFGEEKMAQVQALKTCLIENLQKLKDGDYEPAWNEMKPEASVDWTKMAASQAKPVTTRKK